MKKEIKTKDQLIMNLKERLVTLENKVNDIQKEERRDKSQQRIKEAIFSLEQKLEHFNFDRESINTKLDQMKFLSSMQSSSRYS